jgi:hypothetical protein
MIINKYKYNSITLFNIELLVNMELLDNIVYCGIKTISSVDEDGVEENTEIIANNTTNLFECAKKVNEIREIDFINNKLKEIQHLTIYYYIAIYKYKECGYYNIIDICTDEYYFFNDYKVETKKGILFDVVKNEIKNIKKCIENCKSSDKKKLKWVGNGKLENIGNIHYEYIIQLIKEQNYRCYKCNDIVLTHSYIPYCSYKFSIDRLDNNKPHNIDNIKVSCYFCNCKNHIAFNKPEKIKCENKKCLCNIIFIK